MDPIMEALDTLELGTPVAAANLAMFPLLLPEERVPGYLTLDEALAAGLASVTEVSEGSSVPELRVRSQATWRKSMRKLMQSYGLDALDQTHGPVSDARPQPARFLSALREAAQERFTAIGLGEDVRVSGDQIVGGALIVDDTLIHLVAFPSTSSSVRGTYGADV